MVIFAVDEVAAVRTAVPTRRLARESKLLDHPADVHVFGTSLARILEAVLDTGDIAHLESGRLSDLPW